MISVFERAACYLERCEGAISGSGGHDTTFTVAMALVQGFCLPAQTAFQLLRNVYNPKCSPPWSDAELRHKVASAANTSPRKPRGWLLGNGESITPPDGSVDLLASKSKPAYDPDYLLDFAAPLPDCVDPEYLEIRSQFTCWNRSPAGFLHKVFRKGESVWVTLNGSSSEGFIWHHDSPVQNLSELNQLKSGHSGVWFLSNPIDGKEHHADRLVSDFNPDGTSFRCTECVTDWRHVVIETDCAPADLWLKALVLLELPIVAIYHSGRRGPHALVNLGASSIDQWHALLEPHRERLIRLGACPYTLTPVRLTRLPNCLRKQTGQLQTLLYLAPHADGTPIARLPLREDPLAVWMRYLEATRFGRSDNL
jgi:hypothetical protein